MTPVQPAPAPAYPYWWFARVMLVIAAVCFAIAAVAAGGIFHTPMWAWGFGGFAAFMMAKAAGAP